MELSADGASPTSQLSITPGAHTIFAKSWLLIRSVSCLEGGFAFLHDIKFSAGLPSTPPFHLPPVFPQPRLSTPYLPGALAWSKSGFPSRDRGWIKSQATPFLLKGIPRCLTSSANANTQREGKEAVGSRLVGGYGVDWGCTASCLRYFLSCNAGNDRQIFVFFLRTPAMYGVLHEEQWVSSWRHPAARGVCDCNLSSILQVSERSQAHAGHQPAPSNPFYI